MPWMPNHILGVRMLGTRVWCTASVVTDTGIISLLEPHLQLPRLPAMPFTQHRNACVALLQRCRLSCLWAAHANRSRTNRHHLQGQGTGKGQSILTIGASLFDMMDVRSAGANIVAARTHRRATVCRGMQAGVAATERHVTHVTHHQPTLDYLGRLRARDADPHATPLLLLAPMENLADRPFRLAHARTLGGFDEACIEFMRVPDKADRPGPVVRGVCGGYDAQELGQQGLSLGAQIMGSTPSLLGLAAHHLAHVKGAPRVDLNCGCPANTVTGNGAGSSLLRTPELLHRCAKAMVDAVGGHTLVTVKMRAGYMDTSLFEENLLAAQEAGAAFITLHARTKKQTYEGRADWDLVSRARQTLDIPVVGNGDVVSVAAARALLETGCQGLCIGRGAVQDPLLFLRIRASFERPDLPWEWNEPAAVQAFLRAYASEAFHPHRASARTPLDPSPDQTSPPSLPQHPQQVQARDVGSAGATTSAGGGGGGGKEDAAALSTQSRNDFMTERGKFGRLKKVMKYLFNSSSELAEACEHLLRVQPGTGVSADELVDMCCAEVHSHWPASGPSRLALVNHMSKSKPTLVVAGGGGC